MNEGFNKNFLQERPFCEEVGLFSEHLDAEIAILVAIPTIILSRFRSDSACDVACHAISNRTTI